MPEINEARQAELVEEERAENLAFEELTVQDILDEASENTKYHTILEIWREVMKVGTKAERVRKITPQWANRITSSYREINFNDMPEFKARYFNKIDELIAILDDEISTEPEALNISTPEEDGEINAYHYLNVLIEWQKTFLMWELAWECTSPYASIELAAISEIHRMVFDTTGLTSLLDNIPFEFNDSHRELLATTLQQLRDAEEGQ